MTADIDTLARAVVAGDRTVLAQAITLVESELIRDRKDADLLVTRLLPHTGGAARIGITGSPGVGKSTLIDALGLRLLEAGHRVAVLAVDPSSAISGGSILGDKSRMQGLVADPRAFIRPSPAAGTLGGVGRRTREARLICEAAGFDVILIETVGVGQSETVVADMVDCFVLLSLPGSGDELQGIKRGVVELADIIAVTKSDGDNRQRAALARTELQAALRYLRPRFAGWQPRALAVSAKTGDGLDELWQAVEQHRDALAVGDGLASLRREQDVSWMWTEIEDAIRQRIRTGAEQESLTAELEAAVRSGQRTPTSAALELLSTLG